MTAIEKENQTLKGVLPKDYSRPALNKHRQGELVDIISGIHLKPSPPAPLPEVEGGNVPSNAHRNPLPLGEGERSPGEGDIQRRAMDILAPLFVIHSQTPL